MSHVERRRVGCCSRAWSAACSCAKRLSAGRSNVNCRNAQSSSETTFRVQHSCDGRLHGATCSCAVRYAMNPNAWIQCGRVMHLQVGLPDCACVRCCNRSLYARCRNRMTCVCVGIGRCRPWRCSLAYSADQVSALPKEYAGIVGAWVLARFSPSWRVVGTARNCRCGVRRHFKRLYSTRQKPKTLSVGFY